MIRCMAGLLGCGCRSTIGFESKMRAVTRALPPRHRGAAMFSLSRLSARPGNRPFPPRTVQSPVPLAPTGRVLDRLVLPDLLASPWNRKESWR